MAEPGRRIMRAAVLGAGIAFLLIALFFAAGFPGFDNDRVAVKCIAMILSGAFVGAFVAPRVVGVLSTAVAFVVFLVAMTPLMRAPVRSWVRRDAMPARHIDAVVVLSSGVHSTGVLDAVATERLLSGLALVRSTHASMLITTRGTISPTEPRLASDDDRRALIALGGDTSLWRAVSPVFNTHDEAVQTAAFLSPASAHSIAVVTSPLHSRRACLTFEAVGFHVVCTPSEERTFAEIAFDSPAARLHGIADWLYEQLAMIKYRLHGWLPRR